ncbi:MAG: hypothetical protein HDQ99_18240 [Lachnospiraceae bacterium]|nr:hypothetical protein [Lachnospiraceae bacterium]
MLIFNIPKKYQELVKEISETFDNSELVEVDSLGADTIVQVIVPIITVAIPAVTSIVVKAMSVSSKVEIEWNGIKIKGTEKQVEKFFDKLHTFDEKEKSEKTSKKNGK